MCSCMLSCLCNVEFNYEVAKLGATDWSYIKLSCNVNKLPSVIYLGGTMEDRSNVNKLGHVLSYCLR